MAIFYYARKTNFTSVSLNVYACGEKNRIKPQVVYDIVFDGQAYNIKVYR